MKEITKESEDKMIFWASIMLVVMLLVCWSILVVPTIKWMEKGIDDMIHMPKAIPAYELVETTGGRG